MSVESNLPVPVQVLANPDAKLAPEAILDQIRKLTDVRDHGHLSQRQWDAKRLELLDRL